MASLLSNRFLLSRLMQSRACLYDSTLSNCIILVPSTTVATYREVYTYVCVNAHSDVVEYSCTPVLTGTPSTTLHKLPYANSDAGSGDNLYTHTRPWENVGKLNFLHLHRPAIPVIYHLHLVLVQYLFAYLVSVCCL